MSRGGAYALDVVLQFSQLSERTSRSARVSQPCTVLASAHLALPVAVLGPVEAPPWARHTALPRIAALLARAPRRRLAATRRGGGAEEVHEGFAPINPIAAFDQAATQQWN